MLQLNNVGSILIMNLVFACFDLAGRIGDRASDGLVLMLMYGDRARDALTSLRVSPGLPCSGRGCGGAQEMAM